MTTQQFRIEKDSLGEVQVPGGCPIWGADSACNTEFSHHSAADTSGDDPFAGND